MLVDLMTPEGEKLLETGEQPWQTYPRPQMRRDSYVNLNGLWDFAVSTGEKPVYDRTICVPYCPESLLSGIKRKHIEAVSSYVVSRRNNRHRKQQEDDERCGHAEAQ